MLRWRDRLPHQKPPVARLRRVAWPDAQLALEHLGAELVGTQRAGPVAVQRLKRHQPAVGCLAQGLVSQQLLGVADRRRIVALALQQLDQSLQRAEQELTQTLAL